MDRGEPQQTTGITETRNLRSKPFIQSDDQISTGKHWEDWMESMERELRYFRITDPADKKDALIIYGGKVSKIQSNRSSYRSQDFKNDRFKQNVCRTEQEKQQYRASNFRRGGRSVKKTTEDKIETDSNKDISDYELGTPVQWCSPLVVIPKPKFSKIPQDQLESHMIRACDDLRIPNKRFDRNRITQSPVVKDFAYKFHNSRVFSKMDLRQGYHKFMLHPESRSIATFSTPWGNMRPRRLIFGAKCSQDGFDEQMYKIF
ncbi:Hypothetical predicted protein [Mytilus galloprovincialis]|uniref:Reverse transcriptase domain-containing protein n=1 Tax=Mytilus galloprovincialis TaxID=29158 RepID=A0A8B6HD24_MYTGA|nr:Hypothetical predicted protein [Mytilus galloprovincialis]